MSEMTRRETMGLAGGVATLLAAGRLPVLGSPSGLPAAVSPLQGYLSTHAPGAGAARAAKLKFSILRWTQSNPRSGETENPEIGKLELGVARQGADLRVTIVQTTRYSSPQNRLHAEAICSSGELLSLKSWRVKTSIDGRDDTDYEAEGEFDGRWALIRDGMAERRFAASAPLACLWTLPLAVAAGGKLPERFDLLDDLLLHKPGQRLRAGGPVMVPYQSGEHQLRAWSHTGPGVLPIHYLVDGAGLPQIVTQSALAWALEEASA
jgi:hypothetical protein